MVSRPWTRFSYSDSKRSSPGKVNKSPKKFSGRSELVVLSKTRLLNIHLPRVSTLANQERKMEMRDEVFSIVGAHNSDTSGYQVPDLGDVAFYLGNDQLDVDVV